MSIILKILIGLVLLLVLIAVVIATSVFVAVLSHERRWRKCLSDDYKMYSDASETEAEIKSLAKKGGERV